MASDARRLAHDLRAHLHAARLAADALDGYLAPGGEEFMHALQAALRSAVDLTRSTPEEDVDVAATARRCVSGLGHSGGVRVDIELIPHVRAKPVNVDRVIGNVVANALRYGKHVRISGRKTGRFVEVRVDDDGPGFDEPNRAFEAGVKGDDSPGEGLGLSNCQHLVEEDGGSITALPGPGGQIQIRWRSA